MEMIVEVSIYSANLFGCFLNLWDPWFKFFLLVQIVEPRLSSSSMPAEIGEVGCDVNFGWQKWFVHIGIRNIVLLQQCPSFFSHPGEVSEFDGEFELRRERLEEFFQVFRIVLIARGELDQKASQFPIQLQRLHDLQKCFQILFDIVFEAKHLFMSYNLRHFGCKHEI